MKRIWAFFACGLLACSISGLASRSTAQPQNIKRDKTQLEKPSDQAANRTTMLLSDEIRHQLITLPWYGVFDWLEGEVLPDHTVVLRGAVVLPVTKSDAEKRVKSIEGVAKVENNIEVFPVSPMDDQIRRATYRAIYKFHSPLFKYAEQAVPPIHIIVKGGHVTLKGIVLNEMDRQLAETAARQAPGVFDIKNEITVEKKQTD